VDRDWNLIGSTSIDGVVVKEIRNVIMGSGVLTEIYRAEWKLDDKPVMQVFQRLLEPGEITAWHAHAVTTDRLFCGTGRILLALYDGRKKSPTFGTVWTRLLGSERPALVVVPPGIWHGVQALGSVQAIVINAVDKPYSYEDPDHWRISPDSPEIPFKFGD
jgi:dTDP-4-dehydrorhamnose 3,5-epimerase